MKLVHTVFFAACLSLGTSLPALAQTGDVPPGVQAFLANLERQMAIKPAYETLKDDGSGNVTISNLTLARPAQGEDPSFTMKVGQVALSGITDEGGNVYQIGKASFTGNTVDVTGKDFSFKLDAPDASAEGWLVRAAPPSSATPEDVLAQSSLARKMNVGKITVTAAGETLSVDGIESTWDGDAATGAGSFAMKISNIAIPATLMARMDEGGMLKQLGYSTLSLDVTSATDIAVKGETMSYGFDVGVSGRDMGSLSVKAAVDELPKEVYAEMLKAQMEGREVNMDAMMPKLQNVVVKGGSIRFTDASLVNRLLPLAAAAQGMDEKTLRASIAPTVQLMLVQLQNEAFTKQATEAVTAFFANPKSLTITAAPPAPLKVMDLSAMDPTKPGEAISKLGLSVTAND